MKCNCCLSSKISSNSIGIDGYFGCTNCGLIFRKPSQKIGTHSQLAKHYLNIDPHKKVADAKKQFFKYALNLLSKKKFGTTKTILDIGCGFGYFLDMAKKTGWDSFGVEIADGAAKKARKKAGDSKIFHGTLKEAKNDSNFFDVITLWDVLVEMKDPAGELKECYRILKSKGKIGIRVRNIVFQKIAYWIYFKFIKKQHYFEIKELFVFHQYCFSRKSIYMVLSRLGFEKIRIENSPLTKGDPYSYIKNKYIISVLKIIYLLFSDTIYWLSLRRLNIGPSLLIWAEKPY